MVASTHTSVAARKKNNTITSNETNLLAAAFLESDPAA